MLLISEGLPFTPLGTRYHPLKILYNQKEIAVGTFWGKIINHKTHALLGNQMRESNPPDLILNQVAPTAPNPPI